MLNSFRRESNFSGTSLATLRVQGLILTCGTSQGIVGSVLCCVQLFCTTLCAPHPLSGRVCSRVGILCVFMCVLLAAQHINLREGNFQVAHWLINLCLYIQLHWTNCSVGAVFRYVFLMFLLLFFFRSFVVQASGSSDSQHTCSACEYLKGSFQILGPFPIFFALQIFHGAAGVQK